MSTTATRTNAWQTRDVAPLDRDTLAGIDGWWRAANYLAVGQIYLLNNPLLRTPLTRDHVKPRLLGHWGTTPGLNLVYAHLNRAIVERSLSTIYIAGPGHGGPGLVANAYLEGTYSEVYTDITPDLEGMRRLFRQFSFPGGIPSYVAPETPGSIHEGGELGYALSHAYGAAFDNPDLLVAAVVGDGEAETGPLATSWHSNKFINPLTDGVVLPILHLNGYKIANPTVLARIPEAELLDLMRGYGHTPYLVSGGFDGEDPMAVHARFAATLDQVLNQIAEIKAAAAAGTLEVRPAWPMIILRTPKGWTGPHSVDGVQVEDTWRSHQVPLANARDTAEHLAVLDTWLRSYRPQELFDQNGSLRPELRELAPSGMLRMSDNPSANGGQLLRDLRLPDFRDSGVQVETPGATMSEATRVLGEWLRGVVELNPETFRIFGPDETASNRLGAVLDVTDKQWDAQVWPIDEHLAPTGRVVEMLSEHQCEGWLEGYLLTGRHGLFNCYEAFIHIIDSMFNQHAKWLKVTHEIPDPVDSPACRYPTSRTVPAGGSSGTVPDDSQPRTAGSTGAPSPAPTRSGVSTNSPTTPPADRPVTTSWPAGSYVPLTDTLRPTRSPGNAVCGASTESSGTGAAATSCSWRARCAASPRSRARSICHAPSSPHTTAAATNSASIPSIRGRTATRQTADSVGRAVSATAPRYPPGVGPGPFAHPPGCTVR